MSGPYFVSNPDDLYLTDEELEAKYPGLADEGVVALPVARRAVEWQAGMFSVDEMMGDNGVQS